jgi:hypothetical protein
VCGDCIVQNIVGCGGAFEERTIRGIKLVLRVGCGVGAVSFGGSGFHSNRNAGGCFKHAGEIAFAESRCWLLAQRWNVEHREPQ